MITSEMGKPLAQAIAEVEKSALAVRWLCERSSQALAMEILEQDDAKQFIGLLRKDALGPILGIMPWNFPLWQAVRFFVPALLSGNVVLLKHAANVLGCLGLIKECLQEAGIGAGVFEDLRIGPEAALRLISDARVRGVSLTGSTRAGRAVASAAGQALKPCLLELGGSDPYVVFADADLPLAVQSCVSARLMNNGQSCVAGKRFIVHRSLKDRFAEMSFDLLQSKKIGNPTDPHVDLGPLAKKDLVQELGQLVRAAEAAGRRVQRSHLALPSDGCFFSPVLISGCLPEDDVCQEETFGPVMPVMFFDSFEEAVSIANRSRFGLGATIFGKDCELLARAVRELESGMVFVNDFVRSDVRWPFGGIGDSGFGRELGNLGFLSFSNLKSTIVRQEAGALMKPFFAG